jgi:hypothetical protein
MVQRNLKMFATSLATYARKQFNTQPRGSLLIRLVGEGTVIAGVYGNANYLADERAREEVALVRQRLKEAGIEVMQFGLSLDGYTWALLIRVDDRAFETEAGKAMHREIVKSSIDEIIQDVYRTLYGNPGPVE